MECVKAKVKAYKKGDRVNALIYSKLNPHAQAITRKNFNYLSFFKSGTLY